MFMPPGVFVEFVGFQWVFILDAMTAYDASAGGFCAHSRKSGNVVNYLASVAAILLLIWVLWVAAHFAAWAMEILLVFCFLTRELFSAIMQILSLKFFADRQVPRVLPDLVLRGSSSVLEVCSEGWK